MQQSVPTDLIVTDLYESWESLKEILGERAKRETYWMSYLNAFV